MRVVYLIREPAPSRDIEEAKNFGRIQLCIHRNESNLGMGPLLNRLRSTLRDYEEGDYILWAGGDWVTLVALGVFLKESNFKTVDLLVWRKLGSEGAYVPRRMVL